MKSKHSLDQVEKELRQTIAACRKGLIIPNVEVAEGTLTMTGFDEKMNSLQAKRGISRLMSIVLPFVLLCLFFKSDDSKEMFIFLFSTMFYMTWKSYEYSTNRYLFLSDAGNSSAALHEQVRPGLRTLSRSKFQNLEDYLHARASYIRKYGLAQCYELCVVLTSDLLRLLTFKNIYITQVVLQHRNIAAHEHTVLVMSENPLSHISSLKRSKLASLGNYIVLDPWYNLVIQAKNIDESKYPLLGYDILSLDFRVQAGNGEVMESSPISRKVVMLRH